MSFWTILVVIGIALAVLYFLPTIKTSLDTLQPAPINYTRNLTYHYYGLPTLVVNCTDDLDCKAFESDAKCDLIYSLGECYVD